MDARLATSGDMSEGLSEGMSSGAPDPDLPLAALRERVHARLPGASVLAAGAVALMPLDLPVRGRRQRLQAAPFALEDRLSMPLDRLHVALHPAHGGVAALAAIVDRHRMPSNAAGPVLAETLAVPVPAAAPGDTAWAVWRSGDRAVVRVSDGSGFGCAADMLDPLWTLAGKPAVSRLADPLPETMGAADLSQAPPPPDAADLGFDLRQGAFASGGRHWPSTLRLAATVAGLGLAAHLALAVADRMALGRIARAEVAAAEARLEERLPGARLSLGLPALLDRLAPRAEAATGSAFLPLFSDTAQALLADAPPADVQRLTWDARTGILVLDVTAGSLEDLQAIERSLADRQLAVETGVATAEDGVARADLRIGGAP